MTTTIFSLESLPLPENDEGKNGEVSSDFRVEKQNENLLKNSSLLLGKKDRDGNSYDVVTARNETELKPELERLNATSLNNSTISQDLETSLKIEQAKIEEKDDLSSKSFMRSNTESLENQDDYHFKDQMLPENLIASESAPSPSEEIFNEDESSQKNKINHFECLCEEADDAMEVDMEELIAIPQPTQVTVEEVRVSREKNIYSMTSENTSTKVVDSRTDFFEKGIWYDQIPKKSLMQDDDVGFPHKSRDEKFGGENITTTVHPSESFQSSNDSMRDVRNTFADLVVVAPPASDFKVGEPNPIPNVCDQINAIELEENNPLGNDEVQTKVSFYTPNSTNQTNIESDVAGDHESHPESSNSCNNNKNSISSKPNLLDLNDSNDDVIVEQSLKESISKWKPVLPTNNPHKLVSKNEFKLDGLKALLQYNPSSGHTQATQPINEVQNAELARLEDLLRYASPSTIPPNVVAKDELQNDNFEIKSDTDQNSELKNLRDMLHDSTPSRIQSNEAFDRYVDDSSFGSIPSRIQSNSAPKGHFPRKITEIKVDRKSPRSSQASDADATFPEQQVSTSNGISDFSNDGHPSIPSNYVLPAYDQTIILPKSNQSFGDSEAAYENIEALQEGQLSVFSDATSGQEYLRSMSDAKKQLKNIEHKIDELKGIDYICNREIADRNGKYNKKKGVIPCSETNSIIGSVRPQMATKTKSTERKKRGMEPPPSQQEETDDRSLRTGGRKEKARRKLSQKKQVRPEVESRKNPIEPDGRESPGRRYNHRKMKTSRPSGKTGIKIASNTVESVEQNPARNDPPMMTRGILEAEGSPIYWNDDHSSVEEKTKRKKKYGNRTSRDGHWSRATANDELNYAGCFQDVNEVHTTSVVSSHMDRGDGRWSVPIDEINTQNPVIERSFSLEEGMVAIPQQVNMKACDDGRRECDPWAEVPCSCCCRYLPHTLVVATTHAYRLDRADEKERELK